MTTVQEDLVAVLEDAGLKLYPNAVPAKDAIYPNVVYQQISSKQIRYHRRDGSDSGTAMERPRIQLSVHGRSKATVMQTAQTVKGALDFNQTDFILATRENEMDAKEIESGIYRVMLDYFIWQGV